MNTKYSVDTFKNDLITLEIYDVYHKYMLGSNVWYFEEYLKCPNYSEIYDLFKSYVSNKFNLHFNNVGIVGSAKLGFSIAPNKNLSPYKENDLEKEKASDIDLVLVSKQYFEKFWLGYLDKHYNSQNYIENFPYVRKCLFRKFISFDGFSITDKIYEDWLQQTANYQKDLQEMFHIRHKVNYRIFESWEAADNYYINNLKRIKNEIRSSSYA